MIISSAPRKTISLCWTCLIHDLCKTRHVSIGAVVYIHKPREVVLKEVLKSIIIKDYSRHRSIEESNSVGSMAVI